MSEKYTSKIKFHGNAQAILLYKEIIKRFQDDRKRGNDELSAIKRILFGLAEQDEFETYQQTGANWVYVLDRKQELEFFSPNVPVRKLQDFITLHASKIDPEIIVEMNFSGNTPELVGTRFTKVFDDGELYDHEETHDFTGCYFCAEDDMESMRRDLNSRGIAYNDIISFEELDRIIEDVREQAFLFF